MDLSYLWSPLLIHGSETQISTEKPTLFVCNPTILDSFQWLYIEWDCLCPIKQSKSVSVPPG